MPFTFTHLAHPPPSPLREIDDPLWAAARVRLFVKRDELLAPEPDDPFSGNKWRKLQYNLLRIREADRPTLLSFGGPYSNHIAALASAGRHLGIPTIGVIRGEPVRNPTLERAAADGMRLHFVQRGTYRLKDEPAFLEALREELGPFYPLPEGGSNALALRGCFDLGEEILRQLPEAPTHVAVACGTGGTLAGLVTALHRHCHCLGVSVLKGPFMTEAVRDLLARFTGQAWPNWSVVEGYHHGGYAKVSTELTQFMDTFHRRHGILLDQVYTGKLFFALYRLLHQGAFTPGDRVVAIHTGGLQGRPR